MLIADVYINIPIKSIAQAFTYMVPKELGFIGVGWRVLVSFNGRDIEGFVVSTSELDVDKIPEKLRSKLKPVKAAVDEEAWFSKELIEATKKIADFYLCSAGEIMRLFMPGKGGLKIQLQYQADPAMQGNLLLLVDVYKRLYDKLIELGPSTRLTIKRALPDMAGELSSMLDKLVQYQVVKRIYNSTKRSKAVYEKYVVPINIDKLTPELIDSYKRRHAQQYFLQYIYDSMYIVKNMYDGNISDLSSAGQQEIQNYSKTVSVQQDCTSSDDAALNIKNTAGAEGVGNQAKENTKVDDAMKLDGASNDIAAMQQGDYSSNAVKRVQHIKAKGWTMAELVKAKISLATIKAVAEAGFVEIKQRRVLRDSYGDMEARGNSVVLTHEQENAVNKIYGWMGEGKSKTALLHGVTGSGKTQVYIEAAREARKQGKQVIVLVPEIALTGQVVAAFKDYFTDDIVVMHSRLSVNERNDAIIRVRRKDAGIIIGARSALFTPVDNLGLIIIDEEQDNSYKQDESPRYHARVIAKILADTYNALMLLGSATPSLESYYSAKKGEYEYIRLEHRIGNRPLPHVTCVDMRQELRMKRKNVVSRALQQLITNTISNHEQLILMLNRRGFSTFVMCRSCGAVITCKDCGLPMVYHKNRRLMCHHCDTYAEVPDVCPQCGSRYIKYFGSGTEKLEQELRELVPQARVIRMDRDTTNTKFAHTEILDKFRRNEYDILLGTQMVAKGHDIPNVTAVGILSADSALNMPDFRSAERVFMLITQTAGRAGRGDVPGRVIVQGYNPDHYAVACGVRQDYEAFYNNEIKFRQELNYPPFSRIVKLLFQDEKEQVARQMAEEFKRRFLQHFKGIPHQDILGPAPALVAVFRGVYRFCVLIKTSDLALIRDFLRQKKLHLNMKVAIDIDPISTN